MKFLIYSILVLIACGAWAVNSKTPTLPEYTARASEVYTEKSAAPVASHKTVSIRYIDLTNQQFAYLAEEVTTESANKIINSIRIANEKRKPLYLLIDSPGGSVIDGAHIISAIQASRVPVYTVCMELCASMAAMILEYGTERYAQDRAIIMFHPASLQALVAGELDKIVSRFTFLQRFINKMDQYVASRAGEPYETFKAKSMREHWIDSEDAKASNLIDAIVRVEHPRSSKDSAIGGKNKLRQHINLSW